MANLGHPRVRPRNTQTVLGSEIHTTNVHTQITDKLLFSYIIYTGWYTRKCLKVIDSDDYIQIFVFSVG